MKQIKIGVIGDTHLGSIYTDPIDLVKAFKTFEKNEVELILHTGDLVEGMSGRPDQVYQLTKIGYEAQKNHAIELLKKTHIPIKIIDGNHDRWFIKSNGALIVKDICEALPHCEFIGHDEGDILVEGVKIKLWHGEDGSSYTTSLRPQKVVEMLTQIEEFDVILMGHTHKQCYLYERGIHVISTGSIQKVSSWMKGKRLMAHTGFHIITLSIDKNKELTSLAVEWFPIK